MSDKLFVVEFSAPFLPLY